MAVNNINGVVPPGEVIVDPVTGEDKSRALPRSSNGDQAYNMFRPADMLPPASQGGVVQVQNQVQPQPKPADNGGATTPAVVSQPQPQDQAQRAVVDPNSPTDGLNLLAGMVTTPEQEEKMRKASVQSQRIMAVTNALRHIGNVIGTIHGANAQQFNDPVTEEQQRYLREKAVRDQNNMKFMTYQQAKAAQDARAKELESQNNYRNEQLRLRQQELDRLDKQYELNERKADWQRQYQQGTLDIKKERMKLDDEYKRGMLTVAQHRAATYALNSSSKGSRGGGGKGMDEYTTTTETTYNYDKLGKRTGTTTTKKRTVNGKQQPTQTTKKQLPGATNSGKKQLP